MLFVTTLVSLKAIYSRQT